MIQPVSDDEMNSDQPKIQKIIEIKFPITWLLGVAFLIISIVATAYFKFDGYGREIQALTQTVERLSTKTDTRDERISAVLTTTIEIKAAQTNQDQRLIRTESDIRDLRLRVEELNRTQRWMPK